MSFAPLECDFVPNDLIALQAIAIALRCSLGISAADVKMVTLQRPTPDVCDPVVAENDVDVAIPSKIERKESIMIIREQDNRIVVPPVAKQCPNRFVFKMLITRLCTLVANAIVIV